MRKSPHDVCFQSYYKSSLQRHFKCLNEYGLGSHRHLQISPRLARWRAKLTSPPRKKLPAHEARPYLNWLDCGCVCSRLGAQSSPPFAERRQLLEELVPLPAQGSDCSICSGRWREGTTHSAEDSDPGTPRLAGPTAHVKPGFSSVESFLSHDGQL